MNGPLLAIFPHPDDETFSAAGLLAAATEREIPVTLICATRGEAGESADLGLDDPDKLGAVREGELREAMGHLGVSDVRLLDYRDSGMEGSEEARHPRALVRAPVETVAARIARVIRSVRPHAIVTYGPDGIYGHPDHLHLHAAVVRAVELAAEAPSDGTRVWHTPALYFATAPREELLAVFDRPNSPLASLSESARANLGTPRDEITHVIDVRKWEPLKREAIRAHFTQTGEGGPLSGMPPEALETRIAREHFVRAPFPWSNASGGGDLIDFLARSE